MPNLADRKSAEMASSHSVLDKAEGCAHLGNVFNVVYVDALRSGTHGGASRPQVARHISVACMLLVRLRRN